MKSVLIGVVLQGIVLLAGNEGVQCVLDVREEWLEA